jgi:hypothetical protein
MTEEQFGAALKEWNAVYFEEETVAGRGIAKANWATRWATDMIEHLGKMRQENKVLWDMVDDFNTAVQKAAARLP